MNAFILLGLENAVRIRARCACLTSWNPTTVIQEVDIFCCVVDLKVKESHFWEANSISVVAW